MTSVASVERQPASYPQTNVTAADWLDLACRTLVEHGVEQVRVLPLAQKLGVSRASFYWYFKSRDDILNQLLAIWEQKNTRGIVRQAGKPAKSVTDAVTYLMECWIDESIFDPRLDFAIRDWARRSPKVLKMVRKCDEERVAAIQAMYARHGFDRHDALIRAFIVYFMQIGYYSVGMAETLQARLGKLEGYILAFTGIKADPAEVRRFHAAAKMAGQRNRNGRSP
jgi:AcrR family transcriptional regulator